MRAWRADLASTAFGKIIAVYGHINGNGRFVRKRPALKKAITDKMIKNSLLSVRFWRFRQSSPNLCVNYFFSRALVVQGMPLHPCLRTSTLEGAVKGAPLRTSKRFP